MSCTHRWRLTEPNGPLADAVCCLCGAERKMPNAEQTDGRPLGMELTPGSVRARFIRAERASGWQKMKAKEKALKKKEQNQGGATTPSV